MAAGDLVTGDSQMEFDGLLMGSDTPYGWVGLQGWEDLPDLDMGMVEQSQEHGAYAGQPQAKARVLTWDFQMWPDRAGFAAARAALRRVTAPRRDAVAVPLVVSTSDEVHLVFAQCAKRVIPVDRRYYARIPKGVLQFVCPDPLRYSVEESTVVLAAPGGVSGLVYPWTYPLDYGGTLTPGSALAVNEGDTETFPVLEITGPCTNPKVTNTATGRRLEFTIALLAGETLTVNTAKSTIMLGATDVFSTRTSLSAAPKDFYFVPGVNGLVFETPSFSTGAAVTVTWRSAWM